VSFDVDAARFVAQLGQLRNPLPRVGGAGMAMVPGCAQGRLCEWIVYDRSADIVSMVM
jgi:hypothetical protein